VGAGASLDALVYAGGNHLVWQLMAQR